MSRGGARNRSGPQPDPMSGRSDRRGLQFLALDPGGFRGDPPEWPLADSVAADLIAGAELANWRSVWMTPQAIAWHGEPWRWPIVAEYCRIKAIVEVNPGASAALVAQLHRYRDQIGLTPAGLRENGWQITATPVHEEPVAGSRGGGSRGGGSRGRLKVIQGDGAATG